jgi:phosphate starvation-inducible PhoH-like protein
MDGDYLMKTHKGTIKDLIDKVLSKGEPIVQGYIKPANLHIKDELGIDLGFKPKSIRLRRQGNSFYLTCKEKIEKEISEGNIEILPMSYIRGITFVNTFVIADEVQNLTHTQMEALLGRLGQGSKMVLCGDVSQIDLKNKKNSGLSFLRRVEEQVEGFKIITLKQNHRHSIVQPILDVYKVYAD